MQTLIWTKLCVDIIKLEQYLKYIFEQKELLLCTACIALKDVGMCS